MESSSLNRFDGIVYINLDIRLDRKQELENGLKRLSVDSKKVYRVPGILDELNGTRGCALSHIKALDVALENGWNSIVVLEDDCVFGGDVNGYINRFFESFENNWDVFFLGTRILLSEKAPHSDFIRVLSSLRAHAYIVNGHYIEKVRDLFVKCYESMLNDIFFNASFIKAIDRQWIELQMNDRWYVGNEMVAFQGQSYSDIEKIMRPLR